MTNYIFQLAYDGGAFHGWQLQDNAHSVQAELNDALSRILNSHTETLGCGRTDTGVHAADFYAQFSSERNLEPKFLHSLNSILPEEIAVAKLYTAPENFNVRFDAYEREYRYYIHFQKSPFNHRYSHFLSRKPDLVPMNEACKILMEYSDFQCFSKVHTDVKTFICRLERAQWVEREDGSLVFIVAADRFLRNMVRAMVGTLLNVGTGRIKPVELHAILKSRDRSEAGVSVDAKGLFLHKVKYADGILKEVL